MNDKPNLTESKPNLNHPQPSLGNRFLSACCALGLGVLLLGLLAVGLAWIWLKEPSRPPRLLAGDRQRMEVFLAAHDYEAFLRVMELQPSTARSELPTEWLRRYKEIKPALFFTVREVSTEEVINSEEKYEAPLLSLRWSKDGQFLVDVLEKQWNKALNKPSKVFDGRTGRLVSIPEQPDLLPESEGNWPLGQWNKPKRVNNQLVNRLCLWFGHDPVYWQAQEQRPVLLMPGPGDSRMLLTGFAVNPSHVEGWKNLIEDATGEPIWTNTEIEGQKVAASRRCFNVWKADAFPR